MSEEKSGEKLYKTGEAAEAAGVSRQTLQYYLMVGLIQPTRRTPGGHQLFDSAAIERIRLVKRLNETGYPLREIREIFLQRQTEPEDEN